MYKNIEMLLKQILHLYYIWWQQFEKFEKAVSSSKWSCRKKIAYLRATAVPVGTAESAY